VSTGTLLPQRRNLLSPRVDPERLLRVRRCYFTSSTCATSDVTKILGPRPWLIDKRATSNNNTLKMRPEAYYKSEGGQRGTFQVYIFKSVQILAYFFTLKLVHFSSPKGQAQLRVPLNTPLNAPLESRPSWCLKTSNSCPRVKN